VLALGLDIIWAKYIAAVAKKLRYTAAGWSAAIALTGGLTAIQYIHNPWLLLPLALGSAAGTAIGINRE
jgi:hypothetical protein